MGQKSEEVSWGFFKFSEAALKKSLENYRRAYLQGYCHSYLLVSLGTKNSGGVVAAFSLREIFYRLNHLNREEGVLNPEKILFSGDTVWDAVFFGLDNSLYLATQRSGIYKIRGGEAEGVRDLSVSGSWARVFVLDDKLYALNSPSASIIEVKNSRAVKKIDLRNTPEGFRYAMWIAFDHTGAAYLHYTRRDNTFHIVKMNPTTGKLLPEEEVYSGRCFGSFFPPGAYISYAVPSQTEFISGNLLTAGTNQKLEVVNLKTGASKQNLLEFNGLRPYGTDVIARFVAVPHEYLGVILGYSIFAGGLGSRYLYFIRTDKNLKPRQGVIFKFSRTNYVLPLVVVSSNQYKTIIGD